MNPRSFSFACAVLVVGLLSLSSAENLLKQRVIVVVDSSSYQSTHSTFFNDLIGIHLPLINKKNYEFKTTYFFSFVYSKNIFSERLLIGFSLDELPLDKTHELWRV